MKKVLVIALIVATCLVCTGCEKDVDTQEDNFQELLPFEDELHLFNNADLENDYDYIEGVTEPVRIEENEEELRVNVKGNITSIYKCDGDLVTEWYEKYYFETEDMANEFATSQESQENLTVQGNIVLLKLDIPQGTVMKKSDLMRTYLTLKEVYENE